MAKGYRKCTLCGEQVPSDLAKIINGKAYCSTCAERRLKEINDNNQLRDYLYNLCDKDSSVLVFLLSQVKRMKKEYNFTPTGIRATLEYIFETSDNPPIFKPEYGIEGLVTMNYFKAKKYYRELKRLRSFPEEVIDNALSAPCKEVHLSQSILQMQELRHIQRMKDLEVGPEIDLASIVEEEEDGTN